MLLYLKFSFQSTTSSVDSPSTSQHKHLNEHSDIDDSMVLEMLSCRPQFPDFDLSTLLSTSPIGNSILAYYAANKTLTSKHRNTLTDIITRRIFTRLVKQ